MNTLKCEIGLLILDVYEEIRLQKIEAFAKSGPEIKSKMQSSGV
jgi:hypothetical protein